MKKNTVVGGALILTAAGFITRILGFVYRVYLSNLIGSEGMGLFQLISPVYFLSYTICCSGSFIAISKLVAQENAKKDFGNMRKIVRFGAAISLVISFILSIMIFFGSDFIGVHILHDHRTNYAIKILAFAIPFAVLGSCVKAYFYGTKDMTIPAFAQILEQITRMGIIFVISGFFIPKGLEFVCVMTVIGTISGDLISCIHVFSVYKHRGKSVDKNKYTTKRTKRLTTLFKDFFGISIPLTLNRTVTTLLMSYESIMIPVKLQLYGYSNSKAISVYGELTGMAFPLIAFPALLTNALSMSLLPTIAEASAMKNKKRICNTVGRSLQFTSIIGIGSTCLFATFGRPLGIALYNQKNVGELLFILAFVCPFFYLQSTFGGILNGLGLQNYSFVHNLIGIGIRILILFFLVPVYGMQAFILGLLFTAALVATLNLIKVLRTIALSFDFQYWLIRPTIAALLAGFVSHLLHTTFLVPLFSIRMSTVLGILLLGILYLASVFLLRCITFKEIKNLMPTK